MKYIVEGFSVFLILLWNLVLCSSVLTLSADAAAAKEYKAAVVAQVENSNFNPLVIATCIEDARMRGYDLEITTCRDEDSVEEQLAQINLTYECSIPLIGYQQEKVTRGIAR